MISVYPTNKKKWVVPRASERGTILVNQLKKIIVRVSKNKEGRIKAMKEESVGKEGGGGGEDGKPVTRVSVIQCCNLYWNCLYKCWNEEHSEHSTAETVMKKCVTTMVLSEVSPTLTGSPVPEVSSLYHSDDWVITCSLHPDLRVYRIHVKRENA